MGVCAGVAADVHGTRRGWVCTYPTTYQDVEDTAKSCDGLDNDCDGRDRRGVPASARPARSARAPARAPARWVCDNSMDRRPPLQWARRRRPAPRSATASTTTATARSTSSTRCPNRTSDDKLIYSRPRTSRCSPTRRRRYDANGHQLRLRLDAAGPARSPAGCPGRTSPRKRPRRACEKIGDRLAAVHAAEWLDACNSSGNTTFPYGATYSANALQRLGLHQDAPGVTTRGTGRGDDVRLRPVDGDRRRALGHERQRQGVGADHRRRTTGPFEMRGGAYNIASFTVGTTTTAPGPAVRRVRFPPPRPPCGCLRSASAAAARERCRHEAKESCCP